MIRIRIQLAQTILDHFQLIFFMKQWFQRASDDFENSLLNVILQCGLRNSNLFRYSPTSSKIVKINVLDPFKLYIEMFYASGSCILAIAAAFPRFFYFVNNR